MKPIHTKEEWAAKLILPLYEEGYILTPWNTEDPDKQRKGWTLKNGNWSPWFFNMRPVGDSPELFSGICRSMADIIMMNEAVDLLIAVEMAGIPLVGGLSVTLQSLGISQRFGYTRPLPEKVRLPLEALKLLNGISGDVAGFGQKDFVEGRIKEGDRIAILDDMANDLGSKLIARTIVLWQAKKQGIGVYCDKIFYFLNRGIGNRAKAERFAEDGEPALSPVKLNIDYVVEFDERLPDLSRVMHPGEFEVITSFQKDTSQFQDEAVQKEVLAAARKDRG